MSKRNNSQDLSEYELKSRPRKSLRKEFSSKIPDILKKNIKNLTDAGDSIEVDSFDLTEIIPKTPSPKKTSKRNIFSRLMKSADKLDKSSRKLGDKRLLALKGSNRNTSMLSSPSMAMPKKNTANTSSSSSTSSHEKDLNNKSLNDSFDKFDKLIDEKKTTAAAAPSEEVPEKKSDDEIEPKSSVPEEVPPVKEVSLESTKVNADFINYLKVGNSNLRQVIDVVKEMNASILEYRRQLAEDKEI